MNNPVGNGPQFTWRSSSEVPLHEPKQDGPKPPLNNDVPPPLNTQKNTTPPRQTLPQRPQAPLETQHPPPVQPDPEAMAKVISDPKSASPQEQHQLERQFVSGLLDDAHEFANEPAFSERDRAFWSNRAAKLHNELAALDQEAPAPSWETRERRMEQSLTLMIAETAEWLSGHEGLPQELRQQQAEWAVTLRAGLAPQTQAPNEQPPDVPPPTVEPPAALAESMRLLANPEVNALLAVETGPFRSAQLVNDIKKAIHSAYGEAVRSALSAEPGKQPRGDQETLAKHQQLIHARDLLLVAADSKPVVDTPGDFSSPKTRGTPG